MSAVTVIATFVPRPGAHDPLVAALREAIPAVHEEEGCELYSIHDAEDGSITMVEKWTSRAALDAHSNGEPVARLRELVGPHLAEPVGVLVMTPLPAGTPEQGSL